MEALLNSLKFSAFGTALAVLLGLLHALASVRLKALHLVGYLSLLVSPVAMAFGLLLAFPHWVASQGVLVGAYALLAFPLVTRSISAALAALPANWLAVAATLGANPWRMFWRITMPAIRPSLRNAMALACATCLGEFAVTLFLSRPQWATITTLIHERLSRPGVLNLEQALVLAAMLLVLAWLAFALLEAAPEDHLSQSHNTRGAAHA
jgi:thiamine transport system permease protein